MAIKVIQTVSKSTGITMVSSLIALSGAIHASKAFAQEEAEEAIIEEVIVQGMKRNLKNAQEIKRQADTFVDAISAEDVGALPDRSVLEAMQRIPGVAVERFAGPDDPDHFSVEGSGAVIRGMTQTRSEFNGRDSFNATSGRGLSWSDVPPELVGGVDVYKNQTADMIEGGIGGTVSLRTRKPFDSDGRYIGFNLDYSYGDIAEEWSPTASILFSDRWDTSAGEFGFLLNLADSELKGESHGIQSDAFVKYYAKDVPGAEDHIGDPNTEDGVVWLPQAANALSKYDERERKGIAASMQWRSNDDSMEVTLEYIRSDAQLTWTERAIKYQSGYGTIDERRTVPLDGTEFQFDDQGIFESGTLVLNDGWRAATQNIDHLSRSWGDNARSQWGHKVQFDTRVQDSQNLVEDINLNFKWQVSDQIELVTDVQYIEAESSVDDLVVHTGSFAAFEYDTTGNTPNVRLIEPWLGARDEDRANGGTAYETHPDAAFDIYPGFSDDPEGDANYYQDPNSYFWRSAMDKYDRSEGDSTAIRLDGTYSFEEDGFFRSIKSGIRYAKRDQTNRDTGYNWGSLGPEYSERAFWLLDDGDEIAKGNTDVSAQRGDYELYDWSDFHGGGVLNIPGNQTIHATADFVKSMMGESPSRQAILKDGSSFIHAQDRAGVDSEYGMFINNEINSITETNKAIYVRLDFGGDDDLRYSGNIGLRYVNLKRETQGYVRYPELIQGSTPVPDGINLPLTYDTVLAYLQQQVSNGTYTDLAAAADANAWINDTYNYLSDTTKQFANNADLYQTSDTSFSNILPSFNIKLELTDELIGRFAIAKAVAYPDIGDVRQRQTLGADPTERLGGTTDGNTPPNDETPTEDTLITGAFVPAWTGSGGNPYLKPMKSVQYDFALEWYFGEAGQLSTTIFHKSLDDYFIKGGQFRRFTNPETGVTQVVDFDTTINGADAKMDGVELAYEQFFHGMFEGFGVQANYTYIDASGVPNNQIDAEAEEWANDVNTDTGIRVDLGNLPLQGQSEKTFNFATMYEKYGWNVRLAYNWRSKYLLTTRDVISKAPLYFDDRGQLDGSVFYDISENLTVGIQGTNLTNVQSKTIMILNDELQEAGRSWFVADRRIAFVLRGTFLDHHKKSINPTKDSRVN